MRKGIGPKTAAGLLRLFGNISDIYHASDDDDPALKPAQHASLAELRPRLESVRALVTDADRRAAGRGGGVQGARAEGHGRVSWRDETMET